MKMGSKIDGKSMKSRGCVADAILERFGCVSGGARRNPRSSFCPPFGDHFRPKIEKRRPKRHPKNDAEKGSKISAKIVGKWSQNGVQNSPPGRLRPTGSGELRVLAPLSPRTFFYFRVLPHLKAPSHHIPPPHFPFLSFAAGIFPLFGCAII